MPPVRRRNALRFRALAGGVLAAGVLAGLASEGGAAAGSSIDWHTNFNRARILGIRDDVPVLAFIYAENDRDSERMNTVTFADADVAKALAGAIAVRVEGDPESRVVEVYGITQAPCVIFLGDEGLPVLKRYGYVSPDEMIALAEKAKGLSAAYAAADKRAADAPGDPVLEAEALIPRAENGVWEFVDDRNKNVLMALEEADTPEANVARAKLAAAIAASALRVGENLVAGIYGSVGLDALEKLGAGDLAKLPWRTVGDLYSATLQAESRAGRRAEVDKLEKAFEAFLEERRAIRPKDTELLRYIAQFYSIRLNDADAAKIMRDVVSLGLDNVDDPDQVLWELAGYEARAGEYDSSMKHLEQLVTDYPKSPWVPSAHFSMGQLYVETERPADARRKYEETIQKFPDSEAAGDARRALEFLSRPSGGGAATP
jgi:tetratricopeptide (TPR) repeat protein